MPKGSKTPTFASLVLYIDNDRRAPAPLGLRSQRLLEGKVQMGCLIFRGVVVLLGYGWQ